MDVVGLDISTKTGFVWLNGGEVIDSREITSKLKGLPRSLDIAKQVNLALPHDELFVVIEGYSFGSKGNLSLMVEIGTLIREKLYLRRIPYIEVAPTTLKKFVLGKGVGKKDLMMKEVYKRWGFEGTDNECDAFALAKFGMAVLQQERPTGPRLEAVQKYIMDNEINLDKLEVQR